MGSYLKLTKTPNPPKLSAARLDYSRSVQALVVPSKFYPFSLA